jgi:hypothetical protein
VVKFCSLDHLRELGYEEQEYIKTSITRTNWGRGLLNKIKFRINASSRNNGILLKAVECDTVKKFNR